KYGLDKNVARLKEDLLKYKIDFDVWFSEQTLHDNGSITKIIDLLKSKGHAYEEDGAIWYKATNFGSEKDEVLVRNNGKSTYFAADIAYHYNKFTERHFNRVINIWGADHHGHVARLKGSMDAIGLSGDKLDIVIMQLVRLSRDGEAVRMSKRTGKSVTLSDLLDERPIDAARFFFNLREPNIHLEFDLGLAVSESSQNPVYYIQYAHARICSIIKSMQVQNITTEYFDYDNFKLLTKTEEIELIRLLSSYTEEVISAAKTLDPSKINRFIIDVATHFHKFYNSCHVSGQEDNLTNARLALCVATKTVISNVLNAFKITVPEKM
ncbi:MAG: arginine--tRNA ligase, partial [Oscillospiraceae bacterium]